MFILYNNNIIIIKHYSTDLMVMSLALQDQKFQNN